MRDDDKNVVQLRVVEGARRSIDLTSAELTVISDVLHWVEPLRRGRPAAPGIFGFLARPEFLTATHKIDDAKIESYKAK